MKKAIILQLMIIIACSSYSQEAKKGYLGFSAGPSIPLGDFGSTDIRKEESGLVTKSFQFNVNLSYMLNENTGFSFHYLNSALPIDLAAMERLFLAINPDLHWEINIDDWFVGGVCGGLLFSFPFGKFDFDIKTLIGVSSTIIPQLEVTGSSGLYSNTITQHDDRAAAFAYDLGLGLRYSLTDKLALSINVDRFSTTPVYDVGTTSIFGLLNEGLIKQNIILLNYSLGVGIRF